MFKIARRLIVPALVALAFLVAAVTTTAAGPAPGARPLIDMARRTQTAAPVPHIDSAKLKETASGTLYFVHGSNFVYVEGAKVTFTELCGGVQQDQQTVPVGPDGTSWVWMKWAQPSCVDFYATELFPDGHGINTSGHGVDP